MDHYEASNQDLFRVLERAEIVNGHSVNGAVYTIEMAEGPMTICGHEQTYFYLLGLRDISRRMGWVR